MEISPKRILYLDEVRSLAIILVVLGHIIIYFSYNFPSWLLASGIFSLTVLEFLFSLQLVVLFF